MHAASFDLDAVRVESESSAPNWDDLPRRVTAEFLGVRAADLEITHSCPRCGRSDHGMLRVTGPIDPVFVSRSRTLGLDAVAVTAAGSVGIDIESIERIARANMDAVLLHPAESDALSTLAMGETDRRRAVLWTANEAIVKATGHGLNVDLRALRLDLVGDGVELAAWPGELGIEAAPRIRTFMLSDDIVGATALLA